MKLPRILSTLILTTAAVANAKQPTPVPIPCKHSTAPQHSPICRQGVMNRDCILTIDRRNPSAPQNIIVDHKSTVYIEISNPSFLETLQLDPKSGVSSPQPDSFRTNFTALTTALSSINIQNLPDLNGNAQASTPPQNTTPPKYRRKTPGGNRDSGPKD